MFENLGTPMSNKGTTMFAKKYCAPLHHHLDGLRPDRVSVPYNTRLCPQPFPRVVSLAAVMATCINAQSMDIKMLKMGYLRPATRIFQQRHCTGYY